MKYYFLGGHLTYRGLVLAALAVGGILTGCSKSTTDNPAPDTVEVTGVVRNENGQPLAGATVTAEGGSARTAADGSYTLAHVAYHPRITVAVAAPGFFATTVGLETAANEPAKLDLRLLARTATATFNATTGVTITSSNGQLTIQPNTLADTTGTAYNGTVTAYTRFVPTDVPNFTQLMPGGDFQAINASGEQGMLTSFGFFSVELQGSAGQRLNLRAGSRAGFIIRLSAAQAADSRTPATLPLWWFDRTTGLWKEEGSATRNGYQYAGTVPHFSSWNCDVWRYRAELYGRVVCNGQPRARLPIILRNLDNVFVRYTSTDGRFAFPIPAGYEFTVSFPEGPAVVVPAQAMAARYDLGTLTRCPISRTVYGATWVANNKLRRASDSTNVTTPHYAVQYDSLGRIFLAANGRAGSTYGNVTLYPANLTHTGTYSLANAARWDDGDTIRIPGHGNRFVASAGTLEVTTFTADEIRGTFSFTAVETPAPTPPNTPLTVPVSNGTFYIIRRP